jgi:uncharacterized protein (DUF2336 family)
MSAQSNIIQELEDAFLQNEPARRAETLRRIADLFVSGAIRYSEEQVALFDDVIGRLAAEVEIKAREELANRLAPLSNSPPKTIRKLATDNEISVAAPVLTQSPRLDEAALVEISRAMGQQHLLAISKRKELSGAVTDVLVDRGNRHILQSVAENPGARFTSLGYSSMVQRAEGDDAIAAVVGSRSDLPRHLFLQLLGKASENARARLERSNVQSAREIQNIVESVATRIIAKTAAGSRQYGAARALIQSLSSSGELSESRLDNFAKAGKFEETVVSLAQLCGVSVATVERSMMQERPEMLLILARAAGLSWPTVKSLLVLRGQGRSMSLHDLDQCLTSFHRLKPSTAQQAVRLPRFVEK